MNRLSALLATRSWPSRCWLVLLWSDCCSPTTLRRRSGSPVHSHRWRSNPGAGGSHHHSESATGPIGWSRRANRQRSANVGHADRRAEDCRSFALGALARLHRFRQSASPPAIRRSEQHFAEFSEPEDHACHSQAHQPLLPAQRHRAEGDVEESEMDHSHL